MPHGRVHRLVRACRRRFTRCSSRAIRIPSPGSRSSKIIQTPRCQPRAPSEFRGAFAIERLSSVSETTTVDRGFSTPGSALRGTPSGFRAGEPLGREPPWTEPSFVQISSRKEPKSPPRAFEEGSEMCQVSSLRMPHVLLEVIEARRLPHCVRC
ncbi:uncharacterized protein LOC143181690 [Calliopsis andreniformis]|uniref:uncharacterized protein LOC143181690 n=1 Tax=Calliopsis andreniformis TaxID=337506 RepID=UPI003FCD38B2